MKNYVAIFVLGVMFGMPLSVATKLHEKFQALPKVGQCIRTLGYPSVKMVTTVKNGLVEAASLSEGYLYLYTPEESENLIEVPCKQND